LRKVWLNPFLVPIRCLTGTSCLAVIDYRLDQHNLESPPYILCTVKSARERLSLSQVVSRLIPSFLKERKMRRQMYTKNDGNGLDGITIWSFRASRCLVNAIPVCFSYYYKAPSKSTSKRDDTDWSGVSGDSASLRRWIGSGSRLGRNDRERMGWGGRGLKQRVGADSLNNNIMECYAN
jgi:hypothetical protein